MSDGIDPLNDADVENDEEEHSFDEGDTYVPDPARIWASEAARALVVVLTRRLGPDFAKDMHNEMFARTVAFEESCPDDQRDAEVMQLLLNSPFWDRMFQAEK